jgi:hypothetical protein
MEHIDAVGNWVLLVMAAAAFISMAAAYLSFNIVNNELYLYGLNFNYGWAIPYWNATAIIFVMSWVSIIAAITFQIYRITTIRKDKTQNAEE